MDWLDLLAVQGTLKSLLQHHSSKASNLQHSAFFIVQLSHPYLTTGKTIPLTRQTFVDKVMSLLFNMLSKLVTTFLPRNKHLLISWLQSPSAAILEPPKVKSLTVSIVSPYICNEVMEPDAMILVFWMLSFKPGFSLSSFTFIKRLFSSLDLVKIHCHLTYCKTLWKKWKFSFNIFKHLDPTLASLSVLVCSDCSESAPQLLWIHLSLLSLEVPSPSFLEFSIPGITHFLLPWFILSFGRAHLWDLEFLEKF